MSKITTYLQERFPLATVAPMSLATAVMLMGAGAHLGVSGHYLWVTIVLGLSFVAFLLRTRITDEFKDARHDDANYPNRPVQRGVITRKQLLPMGIGALTLELATVALAAALSGSIAFAIWYLPVLAFSALTAVEFFAGSWLEKHFNTYFLSHQLIFVFFSLWGAALVAAMPLPIEWLGYLGFILYMAALEVVRKFEVRYDAAGQAVPDTYITVWGRNRSIAVLAVTQIAAGLAFAISSSTPLPLVVSLVAVAALVLVRKSDDKVRASVGLAFFFQAAVVFLT